VTYPAAEIYRQLYLIRTVEERVADIYPSDKIRSPVHLSIGQEAVSVAVCLPLRPDDTIFGTYRGHGTYLAKGGDLNAMMAELYGKATGCAHGKGGSMHLVDPDCGVMGTSAVVGTGIANAVGYAYAMPLIGRGRVVAAMFGDGAVEEGVFSESINFAALHSLPIVFVCEHNQYAIHSHVRARQPTDRLVDRMRTYGIDAHRVPRNDVLLMLDAMTAAVEKARHGEGPIFLEFETYRWREHVGPGEDYDLGYRSREDLEPWIADDQVRRLGAMLDEGEKQGIEADVDRRIDAAVEFAEASPFPDPAELLTDVLAD
jgi:TPP-dependent pyruvate/acetoin dehydrogenase alpha subunit